jgi:hypothetical protein
MPAANSYATPSTAGGNREYLRDVLTVLEPEATPVLSMLKKGEEMKGTYAEVLADTFRPARTSGRPEGQPAGVSTNNAAKRQRFGNYPHIFREDFGVTEMQEAVEIAGVASEYDYQKAKALAQLKRDMEAVICGSQDMQQGNGQTEWKSRGLFSWISSTAQTTNAVPADFLTPSAQIIGSLTATNNISSLTEKNVLNMLQSAFSVYGSAMTFQLVGDVATQAAFDNYSRSEGATTAQRYVVNDEASKRQITFSVETFRSSFGIVHLIPSNFVNVAASTGLSTACSGVLLNMALLELQFMKGHKLHSEELPGDGGGRKGYAKVIASLCCKNPKGLGKVGP